MKLTVFVIIIVALSVFAALQLCAQLEIASAARSERTLELGKPGRAVLAVFIFAGMAIIALLSKVLLISTIIAMILSVLLVWANVYLNGIGINALVGFLCIWIGNLISSLYQQSTVGSKSAWATFFIIFEVIMLALLLLGTAVIKFNQYRKAWAEDEEAEEEDEEAYDHTVVEPEDEESEGETSDDEDDEESDDDWIANEERKEEMIRFALNAFLVVIIIAAATALGFYLEWKFDFFPPYKL